MALISRPRNSMVNKKRRLIFFVIAITVVLSGIFFVLAGIAVTGGKRDHPFLRRIFAPLIGDGTQRSLPEKKR